MTTITALPTPPSRADSTNFSTRGDAFLGALPTFATEANAVGSEATAAAAAAAASASAAAASQSTASTAAAAVAAQSPVANAAAAAASAAAAAASAAAAAQTSGAVAATTLSASGAVSGAGFSAYLASPPAIGGTTPAAVSATALSYSTTLTGGTGIVNLGSGQFYKDASGNVGIGKTPVAGRGVLQANGDVEMTSQNTGQLAGLRNRIINGAMTIDQRNAGAAVTITDIVNPTYVLDRWFGYGTVASKFSVQQNAGSVTPPNKFINYFGVTSLSAYSVISTDSFALGQTIEGFNVSDLGWGTANAQTITLSFWVRSSLTGTFGGSLRNSAVNRSYPFTYTISVANTWEQKSVTVAGDTSGTWLTTNGAGIRIGFGLGQGSTFTGTSGAWASANYNNATGATSVVGTNGATLYLTGVQLELGSTATPFEQRPYGMELALCQRYLPAFNASGTYGTIANGYSETSTTTRSNYLFIVTPRVAPTGITISAAGDFTISFTGGSAVCTGVSFSAANTQSCLLIATVASGLTAGQGNNLRQTLSSGQILFTGCEL